MPAYVEDVSRRMKVTHAFVQMSRDQASERQATRYDAAAQNAVYPCGCLVWLHDLTLARGKCRKLASPWVGLFRVIQQVGPVNVRLAIPGRSKQLARMVHVSRLKRYVPRAGDELDDQIPPLESDPSESIDDEVSADDIASMDKFDQYVGNRGDPFESLQDDLAETTGEMLPQDITRQDCEDAQA
jgi:hypothetical protein